jgi:hypothetical protein
MDIKEFDMKKKLLEIGLMALVLSSMTFADKKSLSTHSVDVTELTVLDSGIKRTMLIPATTNTGKKARKTQLSKTHKGIMVRFLKVSEDTVLNFETEYNVKLKTKILGTYYIFENYSKLSDVALIKSIMEHETNLKTLKPNWNMHNTIR